MLSREHKLLFARLLFNARDLLFNNEEATEESSNLGQTKKGDRAAKWYVWEQQKPAFGIITQVSPQV